MACKTYIYVFRKNLFFLCATALVFISFSERARRNLSFNPKITYVGGRKKDLWHFYCSDFLKKSGFRSLAPNIFVVEAYIIRQIS